RMPAYRDVLTAAQVDDLVAFLRAASGLIAPDEERAVRGAELATQLSCFTCHGPLGAGGTPNPRSLKGYVPAFWGADFDDLVRDDAELRAWIAKGEIPRLAEHPIASRFLRRQVIKKPAYPCGICVPPKGMPCPRMRCASMLALMLPGLTRTNLPLNGRVAFAPTSLAYAFPSVRF